MGWVGNERCLYTQSTTSTAVFTNVKPTVKHFLIFGSIAVALDKTKKRKFQFFGIYEAEK